MRSLPADRRDDAKPNQMVAPACPPLRTYRILTDLHAQLAYDRNCLVIRRLH